MLKQVPFKQHKRNNSQVDLFYPNENNLENLSKSKSMKKKSFNGQATQGEKEKKKVSKSKSHKKTKLLLQDRKRDTIRDSILQLVENSNKNNIKKSTVIENINIDQEQDENIDTSNGAYSVDGSQKRNAFFQFGSIYKGLQTPNVGFVQNKIKMEQIPEVPDTMSNQHRYEKEIHLNYEEGLRKHLQFIEESHQKSKQKAMYKEKRVEGNCGDTQSFLKFKNNYKRKLKLNKEIISQRQEKLQNFQFDFTQFVEKERPSVNKSRSQKKKQNKTITKLKLSQSKDKIKQSKDLTIKKTKPSNHEKYQNSMSISNKSRSLPNNSEIVKKNKSLLSLNRDSNSTHNSRQKVQKNVIFSKISSIQSKTNKLEDKYKVLWDCMGEIWENQRIARYLSEKNKKSIEKLIKKQGNTDEKLMLLKSQILKDVASARYKN